MNTYVLTLYGNARNANLKADYVFYQGPYQACKALKSLNNGHGNIQGLGDNPNNTALEFHKDILRQGLSSKLIDAKTAVLDLDRFFKEV